MTDIGLMMQFVSVPQYVSVLFLVVMAGFFMNTVLYMFATAFGFQSMKQWCKSEYVQLLVTLILLALLVAFVETVWNSAGRITALTLERAAGLNVPPNAQLSPFEMTKAYLGNLTVCERDYYAYLYRINFWVEKAANFGQDVTGAEPLGMWYLSGWVGLMHYVNGMLVYGLMLQYVQYFALDYIYITMLQLWLPLGIILRAFPYTRGIGGFMIAFSLGFFFVFPLSYMMIISLPGTDLSCGGDFVEQVRAENARFAQKPICPDYTIGDSESALATVKRMMGAVFGRDSPVFGWLHFTDRIRDRAVYILLQSFFYPIIALTVTFTFIRQTGSLFGADLAEIGRGLIKLI